MAVLKLVGLLALASHAFAKEMAVDAVKASSYRSGQVMQQIMAKKQVCIPDFEKCLIRPKTSLYQFLSESRFTFISLLLKSAWQVIGVGAYGEHGFLYFKILNPL